MDFFFLVAWFHRFFSENHRLNPVVHETHIIYIICSIDITWLDHSAIKRKKHLWIYTPVGNSHLGSFQLLTPVAKRSIWMFPFLMDFHMDWNSSCKLPPYYPEVLFIPVQHLPNGICSLVGSIHFLFWSNQKNGSLKKKNWWGKNPTQLNQLNPKQIFFGSPESRKWKPDRPPTTWRTKVDQLLSYRPPGYGWHGWLGESDPRGCLLNGKRRLGLDLERMGFLYKSWKVRFF